MFSLIGLLYLCLYYSFLHYSFMLMLLPYSTPLLYLYHFLTCNFKWSFPKIKSY